MYINLDFPAGLLTDFHGFEIRPSMWAVVDERIYVTGAVVSTVALYVSLSYHDSKFLGANMGPIWGRQDPGGPHVGPMNFAILGFIS